MIDEVAPAHHPGTGRRQVDRGGHRDSGKHRKAVPAFAHEFQHEIAAQRIAEQYDPIPGKISRQSAQGLRQILGPPGMVMPGWRSGATGGLRAGSGARPASLGRQDAAYSLPHTRSPQSL